MLGLPGEVVVEVGGHLIYIYGLKTQYAPNFSSECPQSGVCIFALIFFVIIETYFSQLFLKIHPSGPAHANGTL